MRKVRAVLSLAAVCVLALALAGGAQACVCADAPLAERLDAADAAVVARLVDVQEGLSQPPVRRYTFDLDQRVKGEIEDPFVVRSPSGTDCDLEVPRNEAVGLLLTRTGSAWFASACSVVAPGRLVAAGGEPRGGVIKVVIGLAILGLVLLWALRRRRRGTRPNLPGAPET